MKEIKNEGEKDDGIFFTDLSIFNNPLLVDIPSDESKSNNSNNNDEIPSRLIFENNENSNSNNNDNFNFGFDNIPNNKNENDIFKESSFTFSFTEDKENNLFEKDKVYRVEEKGKRRKRRRKEVVREEIIINNDSCDDDKLEKILDDENNNNNKKRNEINFVNEEVLTPLDSHDDDLPDLIEKKFDDENNCNKRNEKKFVNEEDLPPLEDDDDDDDDDDDLSKLDGESESENNSERSVEIPKLIYSDSEDDDNELPPLIHDDDDGEISDDDVPNLLSDSDDDDEIVRGENVVNGNISEDIPSLINDDDDNDDVPCLESDDDSLYDVDDVPGLESDDSSDDDDDIPFLGENQDDLNPVLPDSDTRRDNSNNNENENENFGMMFGGFRRGFLSDNTLYNEDVNRNDNVNNPDIIAQRTMGGSEFEELFNGNKLAFKYKTNHFSREDKKREIRWKRYFGEQKCDKGVQCNFVDNTFSLLIMFNIIAIYYLHNETRN